MSFNLHFVRKGAVRYKEVGPFGEFDYPLVVIRIACEDDGLPVILEPVGDAVLRMDCFCGKYSERSDVELIVDLDQRR
jgi:hypothetical protein